MECAHTGEETQTGLSFISHMVAFNCQYHAWVDGRLRVRCEIDYVLFIISLTDSTLFPFIC